MPSKLRIPGLVLLTLTFAITILVSISIPFLTRLDIARVRASDLKMPNISTPLIESRLGIWGYCNYGTKIASDERICYNTGHGYSVEFDGPDGSKRVVITGSWTRGLAVHPVATCALAITLLLSIPRIRLTLPLIIALTLSFLLTLIAFIIDIALVVHVKNEVGKLGLSKPHTTAAPGFWLTFASLLLIPISACPLLLARRRDRDEY